MGRSSSRDAGADCNAIGLSRPAELADTADVSAARGANVLPHRQLRGERLANAVDVAELCRRRSTGEMAPTG
jgi:hypothetical protein